ncbi:Rod shape-determining protein rodA [Granulibacter bethesdensis]|uniref:Peptidoglycan glycosyltransferase MrdB n=1 Tax=Granulibacter bethesdensis TaxID=364410 RepID=A0AAC9P8Q2_9PROT|nr:rod shape-determining protein RodA [Granulibacter bethesdensis]APH54768.1 Rod shape-determining protein rodA [Granulibacter bethesdensis]APH62354.1 Rod shape-determining protein rodA [Granulibacter bethesdensis]
MGVYERRLLNDRSAAFVNKLWRINWFFVLLLCLLAGAGYIALYAAGGGAGPYADKHLIRFAIGMVMMLAIAMTDIRIICRFAWPAYFFALGLLVLVARMGHIGKGAQRWIELGPLQLQPSELMKLFLVLALASWFRKASWEQVGRPMFLIVPTLAVLAPAALILKEPNLGTAVITAIVGGSVFMTAGVRLWKFALILGAAAGIAPFAYHHLHEYQRQRIITFLNPESDPLGAGYNIIQSKIGLGSGGMWGQGILDGTRGNLALLPEKQTDFIFTVFSEQFGFMGGAALLGLLCLIVLSGMATAIRCRHQFGRLLALGLSVNFFMYIVVNVAMVMGAIPVGGVPLPLVSHGGSAMLCAMLGFGLLISVHVHRDVEFEDNRDEFLPTPRFM